jgi:hypothetical protein
VYVSQWHSNSVAITYFHVWINMKPLYLATDRSTEFEGGYVFCNGCDAGHGFLHMPPVTKGI